MYYVYVLKSQKDGKAYIGSTADLQRRLSEHNDGRVFSTRARVPFELVYYEAYKAEVGANGWARHDQPSWRNRCMRKGARRKQQGMVLVEQFRHEVKTVTEGHTTLNRKIDRVARTLGGKIDRVDGKIEVLVGRVNQVEGRITQVEQTLLKRMDAGFAEAVRVVGDLATRLDAHERAHAN
jgi:putative endonuclease